MTELLINDSPAKINEFGNLEIVPAATPKGDLATIQTTIVSVNVVRIGKRQLTQSVFRQLPTGCIFSVNDNDDIFIRDSVCVWGKVYYSFNDYIHNNHSYHIIFSEGHKLYRQYVSNSWIEICLDDSLFNFDILIDDDEANQLSIYPDGQLYNLTGCSTSLSKIDEKYFLRRRKLGERYCSVAYFYHYGYGNFNFIQLENLVVDKLQRIYCKAMMLIHECELEQLFIAT